MLPSATRQHGVVEHLLNYIGIAGVAGDSRILQLHMAWARLAHVSLYAVRLGKLVFPAERFPNLVAADGDARMVGGDATSYIHFPINRIVPDALERGKQRLFSCFRVNISSATEIDSYRSARPLLFLGVTERECG